MDPCFNPEAEKVVRHASHSTYISFRPALFGAYGWLCSDLLAFLTSSLLAASDSLPFSTPCCCLSSSSLSIASDSLPFPAPCCTACRAAPSRPPPTPCRSRRPAAAYQVAPSRSSDSLPFPAPCCCLSNRSLSIASDLVTYPAPLLLVVEPLFLRASDSLYNNSSGNHNRSRRPAAVCRSSPSQPPAIPCRDHTGETWA